MQDRRSNQLRWGGQTCNSNARNLTDVLIEHINLIRRPVSSSVCVWCHGASRIDRATRRILLRVFSTLPQNSLLPIQKESSKVFITLSVITACRSILETLDNNNVAQQCKTDSNILPMSNATLWYKQYNYETTILNGTENINNFEHLW